jgi:hypothetical protein
MGLTVCYTFEFRGSKTALRKKLEGLRQSLMDLPVRSVGEVIEVKRTLLEFGYGKYKGERFEANALGFMMALSYFLDAVPEKAVNKIIDQIGGTLNEYKLSPTEKRRYRRLRDKADEIWRRRRDRIKQSGNGFVLRVDIGEGCENFVLMLGRIGKGKLWRGTRYTKTQYAVHFVDAHLTVIKILDLCKEAGILKNVHDEGEFWQTRDLEVLAKNINESTATILAVGAMLKGPAKKAGFTMQSAIDKSMNLMQVRGRKQDDETRPRK